MAEAGNPDAGNEIDIDVAIGVGQRCTFAMVEREARKQRNSLPSGSDVALFGFKNLLRFRAW